jgi:hypothetical protein
MNVNTRKKSWTRERNLVMFTCTFSTELPVTNFEWILMARVLVISLDALFRCRWMVGWLPLVLNTENCDDAGRVRVYSLDGTLWKQLGTDLDGEASTDQSG